MFEVWGFDVQSDEDTSLRRDRLADQSRQKDLCMRVDSKPSAVAVKEFTASSHSLVVV